MEVEIARVGYEIDQAEVDERHDVQEKHDGLQKVLPIGLRIFRRAVLFFHYSGVDKRMRYDQLAKVQRGRQREISDRRRVDRARVDRPSLAVGLRQQREQVGLERPEALVEVINLADLIVSQLAANLNPVLFGVELQDIHDPVLQHKVSFADAALIPGRAQRLRLWIGSTP